MGEGRYISANGLEVYYREFGKGKPLILLHGATDTHILWQPFIPILSESFRVFTPDSRGSRPDIKSISKVKLSGPG